MLDAHLSGAEHMARRMERNAGCAERALRSVLHPGECVAGSQTVTCERLTRMRDEVLCTAMAQMVAVRMGNQGGLYGLPGIDVEMPGRAVKTEIGDFDP